MSDEFNRKLLVHLFPERGESEAPPEPEPRGNVSPREGNHSSPLDPDQRMRDFVRHLFHPTD